MLRTELSPIAEAAASFPPISLDEMASVRLMNRTDTKFVISLRQLAEMLHFAKDFYRVQETLGQRLIEYRTVYYDTTDWQMLRMHVTGRKSRQKVRARSYVDSNLTFVEVKKKDNHGRTRKKRIQIDAMPAGQLTAAAADFVSSRSWFQAASLTPAVANTFRRITLVNNEMTERLTIDLGLCLDNLRSGVSVRLADTVIV
ncbi:polyphosphate polymerase domain-containing protein, partial [Salmonella enterica]|nr:polyphosphate polymerase domain-containing protein [Salmonella enterica]